MRRRPSTNGHLGRDSQGRFAHGNPGGPGNPYAQKVQNLRRMLLDTVTEEDLKDVVCKLVAMAKDGSLRAVKELFDRLFGRARESIEVFVPAPEEPETYDPGMLTADELETLIALYKKMQPQSKAGEVVVDACP